LVWSLVSVRTTDGIIRIPRAAYGSRSKPERRRTHQNRIVNIV
jgi:hypothetical protein